jgi:hypothetical protein
MHAAVESRRACLCVSTSRLPSLSAVDTPPALPPAPPPPPRTRAPNSKNWSNLWRMLKDLPHYEKRLKGRILADLANEPSRWGCQWDRACRPANSTAPACAPGVWLYASAASGIHSVDKSVPILIEGMGQDVQRGKYAPCAPTHYPGACGCAVALDISWGCQP